MKILHVSASIFSPLDEEMHHSKKIWLELAKGADEYHVFARNKTMAFSNTTEGNLHLHLLPRFGKKEFYFFPLSFLLPLYIWLIRPTHVLVQCPVLGGLVASIFNKIFNYGLFIEIHGEHYFLPVKSGFFGKMHHQFFKKLSKFSLNRADKIRSLSSSMSEKLIDTFGVSISSKIKIIPNRVDLDIFNTVKSEYEIGTVLNVISVGRFSKLKNHSNLIKDLYASGIKFHLTVVGGGDLKSEFYELVESLGSINDLTILENITHSELSKILPLNDVYIHYSTSEGVPRAILEAMACGLPVISTNVGYIDDLLQHQVNSIVIDLPYKESLIDSLSFLMDSTLLRKNLGRNARLTIEKSHEWNLVFDLYREEIKSCKVVVH